jgi:single-stranded-DNA-specific exonuclease
MNLVFKNDQFSRTGKKWVAPPFCERDVLFLKQKYDISDMVARLVSTRIRTVEEAEEVFSPLIKNHLPDPSCLPDIEKAFEHVYECLLKNKAFGVWGDYDVDGACSSALFVRYFRSLGMAIEPYIPDRFQEGYGPNIAGLLSLKNKGMRDVFIVDCGSTAFAPLASAKEQGMTIIVIDHHRVGSCYPDVHAFINPKRPDYEGPSLLRELCAGGLVFLFLVGLNRYLRWKGYFENRQEPNLFALLDLVALSTICDMMPLRHVNRAFVKQGLKVIAQKKNIGLTCLMDASRIRDVPNPIHLGYTLGPRINAGGRVGDSSLGVRLLSCEDKTQSIKLAQELNQLNQERQAIERLTLEKALIQAREQSQNPYLFVYGDSWHEGVLGIIASHLKENFSKPAFVFTAKGNLLKGSVRSVPGIDIGEFIHLACDKGLLVTGGGHPMAGGLTFERLKKEALLESIDEFFKACQVAETHPTLTIDMGLTFEQVRSPEFLEALDLLEPFGSEYPQPKFLISNVMLTHVNRFGYNNLRMYGIQPNGQSYPMIYFRQADKEVGEWLLSKPSHRVDCVVTVQSDYRWRYRRAILVIEDIC